MLRNGEKYSSQIKFHVLKLIVCLSFILLLSSCSYNNTSNNKLYEKNIITMDTPMDLKAYGPNAQKAVDESVKELYQLNDMASTTVNSSDIMKINNASGKNYVKVNPEIIKMIKLSQKYSKISNGKWDITVGPIVNLWGIGTDKARLPSDSEIKSKLPLVGYDKIKIDEKNSSVMLMQPGMALDLGGIAKGFAADEVLKIYKKYNIKNGLIDLGSSSIYAVGKNESNSPWGIGIKNPRGDDMLGTVKLSNEGLSTSGDYERYFIKNGKRYHHILDPATGYPVDNGVMSVTVIVDNNVSDSNTIADIMSLLVFELGPKEGIDFVNKTPGISCEVTTKDNKVYTSSKFKDKFSDLNKNFKMAN
ncbi:FAD:protein FMN transferase [Clostridium ljungdahlii]|uniref:FAD:protein FMN transferase n=1 Tax=Clostridium ljungdahlii TaxID=1538 RepID=A0A168LE98_9CLOT|nr:FAD:protein FMN transferase [Clostridium ljungdahlii]OAA83040.1 Thiamine biosynthesis lipoprotein ApbE precursor [Clostridium ljungdahlii]